MTGPLRILTTHLLLAFLSIPSLVVAQCTITSTTGYSVVVEIYPIAIVPSTTNCPWGYNYNVRLAYDITFSGAGAPASMYTLQGRVVCGDQPHFFNLPNSGGSGEVISQENQWRGVADCNTADVISLNCFTVQIEIAGPGISSRTVDCAFSPLPVELVDFTGEQVADEVALRWTTATERNSAHFALERSRDGLQFEHLLNVPAAGFSSTLNFYQGRDTRPLESIGYYRLRQVDTDGSYEYGPVIVVNVTNSASRSVVHPNPNTGRTVRVASACLGGTMQLFDAAGRLRFTGQVPNDEVLLPELPPGVYIGSMVREGARVTSFRYVQQ